MVDLRLFQTTRHVFPKRLRERIGVEELTKRFQGGRDLWSGAELVGKDVVDWIRLQFEQQEQLTA